METLRIYNKKDEAYTNLIDTAKEKYKDNDKKKFNQVTKLINRKYKELRKIA